MQGRKHVTTINAENESILHRNKVYIMLFIVKRRKRFHGVFKFDFNSEKKKEGDGEKK